MLPDSCPAGASAGWGVQSPPSPRPSGWTRPDPEPWPPRVAGQLGEAPGQASPEGGNLSQTPLRMLIPVPRRLPQSPSTLHGPSSHPAGDRSLNPVQLRWGLGSSCQPFRSQALLWLRHVTCGPIGPARAPEQNQGCGWHEWPATSSKESASSGTRRLVRGSKPSEGPSAKSLRIIGIRVPPSRWFQPPLAMRDPSAG